MRACHLQPDRPWSYRGMRLLLIAPVLEGYNTPPACDAQRHCLVMVGGVRRMAVQPQPEVALLGAGA